MERRGAFSLSARRAEWKIKAFIDISERHQSPEAREAKRNDRAGHKRRERLTGSARRNEKQQMGEPHSGICQIRYRFIKPEPYKFFCRDLDPLR